MLQFVSNPIGIFGGVWAEFGLFLGRIFADVPAISSIDGGGHADIGVATTKMISDTGSCWGGACRGTAVFGFFQEKTCSNKGVHSMSSLCIVS